MEEKNCGCDECACERALKFDTSKYASGRWKPRDEEISRKDATIPSWTTPAVADATRDNEVSLGEIYPSEIRDLEELLDRVVGPGSAQQKKLRVCVAFGTRPEKIKLAPVIEALRARGVEVVEWCSGQSKDFVGDDGVAWPFLTDGTANCMAAFGRHLRHSQYDCVMVQGDTATAFACAQAAFLARVPVAHVEAGLRTYECEPWPEEAFRRQIAAIARWHFAPDEDAATNILRERGWQNRVLRDGAEENYERARRIYVVGNTVIDTLPQNPFRVLVTLHRRENWGTRRIQALDTLANFAHAHDNVAMTLVRHPNGTQDYAMAGVDHLLDGPFSHSVFLDELREADLVVTDSGGLQEEAAHFGVDCLVLRSASERTALVEAGAVELVDPDAPESLLAALTAKLNKRRCYGDGSSGKKIAEILIRELSTLADKE